MEILQPDTLANLRHSLIVMISFCIRWSLKPEWDIQKIMLLKGSLQFRERSALDKMWGECLIEVRTNAEAMAHYAQLISSEQHEAIYLMCARIVSLKGFEEDIQRLVQLKRLFFISDPTAEHLIDLAKQEAQLIRNCNGY